MRKFVGVLLRFGFATLVGIFAAPPPSSAAQSSYRFVYIPGVVEAENFDSGGEGEAYHDTTAANEPGAYRPEGVDVEASSLASNGHDVGWVRPGEWLEYTVQMRYSTLYTIGIRYASDGPGGTVHVEVDGIDISGPVILPSTGGWQNWRTINVYRKRIEAGTRVLRLVFDEAGTDGWLANVDSLYIHDRDCERDTVEIQPYYTVPGRIEAEWYDYGGEGLAYHDTTPINEPGAWRSNGVDIERTQDPTEWTGHPWRGYDIGWIRPGEWLTYTVMLYDLPAYTLHVRYATAGYGGSMHIEFDGVDRTGPIHLPDTGGWQTWSTVAVPNVVLPGGRHVMKLVFDTPGPGGWLANINYIEFHPADGVNPRDSSALYVPGRHEVERYREAQDSTPTNDSALSGFEYGVDVERTQDEGGRGYDVGWITPGEWLQYSVTVLEPGTYNLEIRYATLGYGGTMHVEFDGVDKTGPITLPDTGGWQTWQTFTISNVQLSNVGRQSMRLVFDQGNTEGWLANINWVRFTRTNP